jgi:hypothetical protein
MKANEYELEQSELLRSTPPAPNFKLVDVVNAITEISEVTATQLYSVARKYMIWRRRAYFIAVHDLGFSHPQTAAAMQRDSTSVTYALKTYAAHEDKTNLDIIRMFAAREAAKRQLNYKRDKPDFQIVGPLKKMLEETALTAKPRKLRRRLRGLEQTARDAPTVIIESPYFGADDDETEANVEYARRCLSDSISRGEAPFASHLLYTQVLSDHIKQERQLGMQRALFWYRHADCCAVYMDRGVSIGMRYGMQYAREIGLEIDKRWIKT